MLAGVATEFTHIGRQFVRLHDAGCDGVFEVVAHVRDAIGPTDDLALGCGGGGEAPGVVADPVEGFATQIEGNERDVGTPDRMIETVVEIRRQGVFAGMTPGAVAAVVAEGDGLGERHVETEGACNRYRDLRHFEGMSESRALMVVGKDEDLGLAGQPTKSRGVQDAITIPLETCAERIGFFGNDAVARADRSGGETSQTTLGQVFACLSIEDAGLATPGPGVAVRHHDRVGHVAGHGAGPSFGPGGEILCVPVVRVTAHVVEVTSEVWQELGPDPGHALGQYRDRAMSRTLSQFVDECQLNVRAGDGGAGCVAFRREGPVAMGGPNGGDGGKGGDVWLVADRNVASLLAFRDHPHRIAGNGVHGKGKDLHGRRGETLEVTVPEGTVVRDMYSGEILADLQNHGDRWLAAHGGRGGRGNARFLTNRRRAPSFAEQGEHGEERWLKLELKLLADVALVGFPNAGKSTFISVVSAAKPKIADYPFTTLEPNLGVVRFDDGAEFIIADIPGLIEGAAEGRGLGHRFLRHVERARVLCILVDLAPVDDTSPDEQVEILLDELGKYDPVLLTRPRVIVGTKTDMADPTRVQAWSGPVISSITRQGVRELIGRLASLVHEARDDEPVREGHVILRPESDAAWVERIGERHWRIHGRKVERAVHLNDVTTPDALSYIDERLAKLGVPRLLSRAGVVDGDVVWIGGFSFDYHRDL